MKKGRDEFDMIFRSKLENFETDLDPTDWEAIAKQLDGKRGAIPLRRRFQRYWIAAAVVVLLLLTGEIYHYSTKETGSDSMAERASMDASTAKEILPDTKPSPVISDKLAETGSLPSGQSFSKAKIKTGSATAKTFSVPVGKSSTNENNVSAKANDEIVPEHDSYDQKVIEESPDQKVEASDATIMAVESKESNENNEPLVADNTLSAAASRHSRWGFGMGAGSISAGSNQSLNGFLMQSKSSALSNETLGFLNSPTFYRDAPKTAVKHKTPISFGGGVSYTLTDRWALQSGLMFTLLSSEWTTNMTYHAELKQRLYYLGVPLGVSYKIAEWQRFQFYWSGSFMSEYLLTGTLKSKLFSQDILIGEERDNIHMKPWQFSVNTHLGVSYPLFRFVSAFAEGGVVYYFDNGSAVETIRTEKPFNLNFQVGIRLGF